MHKNILSVIAIAITLIAFLPYIISIRRGKTKPHVFSWIIWGLATLVVFFAQLADHGGVGAWPIGVSALITFYVAGLAYRRRADISITQIDWGFLTLALASLPLWYLTNDPLWSVILLTSIDLMGFVPTFRKAYYFPFQENVLFFSLIVLRNIIVILALENYSLTTVLFPAAISVAGFALVVMTVSRRMG